MEENLKQLLLTDLSARLPYGVMLYLNGVQGTFRDIQVIHKYNNTDSVQEIDAYIQFFGDEYIDIIHFKPYLRPMSSMTEEDMEDFAKYQFANDDVYEFLYAHKTGKGHINVTCTLRQCTDNRHVSFQVNKRTALRDGWRGLDWLNKNHFDYRGLIEKGLALEAPEGMYE